MESSQARSRIHDTFTQPFDKGRFKNFIANILNNINEAKAARWTKTYIKEAFRPRVKWYERIATYTDPNDEKLDVLIVYLERQSSLERARTSLRNFVADYLTTGHGQDKSAVLAAFVSPDETDWRFSFVKLEYESAADASGKVKVAETLTPARRYSFLVGAHEHSHTAQKQFLPLLERDDASPSLDEIEKAFDIEKVTKEFFRQYKNLFENVGDALKRLLKTNTAVYEDFGKKGIDTDDFAKKLLGQIVFLYFLQKKGWFGVERGAEWGTGNKQFLRYLFDNRAKLRARQDRSAYRPVNFFNDVLEHLFYDALARERDDDYYARFDCRIPFLNGGLFEPLFGYDWVNTEILLPDALFSNNERTKEGDLGTGILDVFDRYNFTVNEAEPLEKEVAVDPEMLGKVFENLLPENLRYKGGTYYTPRPIVGYMCRQSLINYLSIELPEVPRDDIERFIRIGYVQADFEAGRVHKYKDKFLDESISRNAQKIDKLLENITVCDLAIGSGAFPVGMMQEIVRAREALSAVEGMLKRSTYELKRHAIQNSLYGVDIDPGAVEIAKLRLWLSLVVDEDDRNTIQALPNLDYKIMQGNSLLDEFAGVRLLDDDLITQAFEDAEAQISALNSQINERDREIARIGMKEGRRSPKILKLEEQIKGLKKQRDALYRQADKPEAQASFSDLHSAARTKLGELKLLHREFFDTSSASRKKAIRERLDTLEWEFMEATLKENGNEEALRQLRRHRRDNRKNYFLWKLHFLEVFEARDGFDVMIANPPYISHDKITEKQAIRRRYSVYEPFADIYCYFIELGVRLLNNSGTLMFITSNSYIKAEYGQPLRSFLSDNTHITHVINLDVSQVFEAAIVNVCILGSITQCRDTTTAIVVEAPFTSDQPFDAFVASNEMLLPQSSFQSRFWTLQPSDVLAIKHAIESAGPTLEALGTKIRLGLATGANEAFLISSEQRREFIKRSSRNSQIIKPVLRGRDIHRYYYSRPNLYIILTKNGIKVRRDFPDIYEHLATFGPTFKKRGAQGDHWTNLRACSFFDDFKQEKIVWIELSDRGRFAISQEELYLLNSAYFLLPPEQLNIRYLLGVLNSSLINFYLRLVAETSGMGTSRWINNYVKNFPIPTNSDDLQSKVIDLVDVIIATKRGNQNADTSKLEAKIDRLVYQLYGLTEKEIAIVENASK